MQDQAPHGYKGDHRSKTNVITDRIELYRLDRETRRLHAPCVPMCGHGPRRSFWYILITGRA